MVSASDLQGLAALSEGLPGAGPEALSDASGAAYWRFEGAAFLDAAGSLTCDSRDLSVFLVGRVPATGAGWNRLLGLGSRKQGTQVNTLNGPLDTRTVAQDAGYLSSFGKVATTAAGASEWMVPGSQLQVMGAATHATGSRLFLNERFVDVAAAYIRTGIQGAEIGRYPWSPSASGNWGVFDLYELVVFSPGLTDEDALAVSQALMTAHDIVPVTDQLVLEGDSIMAGTGEVTPGRSPSMILSETGAGLVPPGWRVINKAAPGSRIADLSTRRDTPNGWAAATLPGGRNVMAFEIGRNDWASGGATATELKSDVQGFLSTTGSGVLQRGWDVRVMANIASAPGLMPMIEEYRAAMRDPAFLDAIAAGPGQTYDGRVAIISSDLVEDGGQTVFLNSADAADQLYYAGDSTHPSIRGAIVRITGGDTPEHGVAAGLL